MPQLMSLTFLITEQSWLNMQINVMRLACLHHLEKIIPLMGYLLA
uniref:Uncharacterized protein n=1 Tax=Arundo donax TaxID=35708 RepID=A0A0A9AD34_ARUDO